MSPPRAKYRKSNKSEGIGLPLHDNDLQDYCKNLEEENNKLKLINEQLHHDLISVQQNYHQLFCEYQSILPLSGNSNMLEEYLKFDLKNAQSQMSSLIYSHTKLKQERDQLIIDNYKKDLVISDLTLELNNLKNNKNLSCSFDISNNLNENNVESFTQIPEQQEVYVIEDESNQTTTTLEHFSSDNKNSQPFIYNQYSEQSNDVFFGGGARYKIDESGVFIEELPSPETNEYKVLL